MRRIILSADIIPDHCTAPSQLAIVLSARLQSPWLWSLASISSSWFCLTSCSRVTDRSCTFRCSCSLTIEELLNPFIPRTLHHIQPYQLSRAQFFSSLPHAIFPLMPLRYNASPASHMPRSFNNFITSPASNMPRLFNNFIPALQEDCPAPNCISPASRPCRAPFHMSIDSRSRAS